MNWMVQSVCWIPDKCRFPILKVLTSLREVLCVLLMKHGGILVRQVIFRLDADRCFVELRGFLVLFLSAVGDSQAK